MSELFNQSSVKTSLDLGQIMASGVPSQIGCDNITVLNLLKQFAGDVSLGNKSANFTHTINAEYRFLGMIFKKVSGTPVVKVGTTLGGDEIYPETTVADISTQSMLLIWASNQTVYFTVSGGTISVELIIRPN